MMSCRGAIHGCHGGVLLLFNVLSRGPFRRCHVPCWGSIRGCHWWDAIAWANIFGALTYQIGVRLILALWFWHVFLFFRVFGWSLLGQELRSGTWRIYVHSKSPMQADCRHFFTLTFFKIVHFTEHFFLHETEPHLSDAMPLLLGICSHHSRRRRFFADGKSSRQLVTTPWFTKLVADHKLEELLKTPRECSSLDTLNKDSLDVIVSINERTKRYDGPLTDWNDQEEYLWKLLAQPFGAVSLQVDHAVLLTEPGVVQRPDRLKALVWSPAAPATNLKAKGVVVGKPAEGTVEEDAFLTSLQVSRQQFEAFVQEPVCLAVPQAVFLLIRKGVWNKLMLKATWHHRSRGKAYMIFANQLGFREWHKQLQQANLLDYQVTQTPISFAPSSALGLAKSLRKWAPAILQSHLVESERLETKVFLEETVLKLENYSSSLGRAACQHARSNQISPDKIVKALCVCMNLKNRSQLGATLKAAIDAAFPGMKDELFVKMPSGSALSRKQILVDAAYCCYWRDLLTNHEGPLYLWADSSPQGGVDWLLSIVSYIKRTDLQDCAEAADYLCKSVQDFGNACQCDDKDAMLDISQKRHDQGLLLKSKILHHRQVPMALGSGASSLEHKIKCMCRKLFSESQSFPSLTRILSCIRCICTDMGTEMGMPDYQGASLQDVLPSWMKEPELFSEDVPVAVQDASQRLDEFIFPEALLSPGILHICHNMTKEIDASLKLWTNWLPGFKALAHLLHHDHLRQRLVAFCVKGTDFEWLEEKFNKGVPKPIEWRWGNVSAILPQIIDKKQALQAVWNPARFKGDGDELREGDADSLNIECLTNSIRSPRWWYYADMLLSLHTISDSFSSWAEGCECHGWLNPLPSEPGMLRRRREFSFEAEQLRVARSMLGLCATDGGDGDAFLCPMAGRRAADLACKAAQSHFQQSWQSQKQALLQKGLGLDMAEMQEVLADFAHGASAMQGYMCQKLQCWDVLPWKLAGIGNVDANLAMACAKSCLEDFVSSPQDQALHHRITWSSLSDGSAVRLDLEAFISGEPLKRLNALSNLVHEFKFVPTVERIQEGDHSIVNRMVVYRNVSGPYVSCALRVPEIKTLLTQPEQYSKFLQKFDEVACPDDLAKRFGFYRHPLWQEACDSKSGKRQKQKLSSVFMYALDVDTQFQNMSNAKKGREKRRRKQTAAEEKWREHFQRRKVFSEEAVEQDALSQHLQGNLEVGRLYSLPKAAVSFLSLSDAIKPAHLKPQALMPVQDQQLDGGQLLADTELLAIEDVSDQAHPRAAEESLGESTVFFRLTCARPGRHKLVRLPAACGTRLAPSDLCVTLHKSTQQQQSGCFVDVDAAMAEGINMPIAVLSVNPAHMQVLKRELLSWSTVKGLSFRIEGLEHAMCPAMLELLLDMVQAKAFPSESRGHVVEAQRVDMLHCAQQLLHANIVEERECRHFVFTDLGLQKLRHTHKSTTPVRFFKSVQELADLEPVEWKDCSSWELMVLLKHHGWILKRAPDAKVVKRDPLPPHTLEMLEAGNLVWYLRSSSLQQQQTRYMLSLLNSEMLFRNHSLLELHHCQPKKYYEKVLLAESDGVLAVQAIRDAGEGLEPLSLAVDCHQEIQPDRQAIQDDVPERREEPTMPPVARLALAAQDEELDEEHTSDSYMMDFALGTPSGTDEENPMEVEPLPHQASVEPEPMSVDPVASSASSAVVAGAVGSDSAAPSHVQASGSVDKRQEPLPAIHVDTEASAEPRAVFGRNVHPDSFVWGPFRLTFSDEAKRPPHGAWQATCPYHRLNAFTGCKRSMVLGAHKDSKDLCKRVLMTWCLEAPLHKTKKAHAAAPCKVEDALAEAVLKCRLKELPSPPRKAQTDAEIEAAESEANEAQPPAAKRARKKAAKSKTEPKGKQAKKSAKRPKAKAAKTSKKSSSSSSDSSSESSSSSSDSSSSDS